jgi:hypothetical protein
VDGYGGAVVGVWWCAGARWEGHFQTEDGLVGSVWEFVFVDDFEGGEGGALGLERVVLEARGWRMVWDWR